MNQKLRITPAALSADTLENFIAAATPGGIEAQEARGQQSFVRSATLPIKFNSGTKAELESMGVVFGEPTDNLFCEAQLPEGWRVEPTDHSMWNKLIDDKGRERASIFYKAAFYDRDAFINVNQRYGVSGYESCDAEGNPMPYESHTHFSTVIQDGGKTIRVIGVRDERSTDRTLRDKHSEEANAWLSSNYPDWQDRTAYWNE